MKETLVLQSVHCILFVAFVALFLCPNPLAKHHNGANVPKKIKRDLYGGEDEWL